MVEETATRIALCEREQGIDVSVEDSLKVLKFGLVEVVYQWASGMVSTLCVCVWFQQKKVLVSVVVVYM